MLVPCAQGTRQSHKDSKRTINDGNHTWCARLPKKLLRFCLAGKHLQSRDEVGRASLSRKLGFSLIDYSSSGGFRFQFNDTISRPPPESPSSWVLLSYLHCCAISVHSSLLPRAGNTSQDRSLSLLRVAATTHSLLTPRTGSVTSTSYWFAVLGARAIASEGATYSRRTGMGCVMHSAPAICVCSGVRLPSLQSSIACTNAVNPCAARMLI